MTINEELAEFNGCGIAIEYINHGKKALCGSALKKDSETYAWEDCKERLLCPSCRNRKLAYIKGRLKGFEDELEFLEEKLNWTKISQSEVEGKIWDKITQIKQNIKILKEEQEKKQ